MATRFYLPSFNGSVYNFSFGSWNETSSAVRRPMQTSAQANGEVSTFSNLTVTKSTAANPDDVAAVQYISFSLEEQTILNTGYIKGVIRCIESSASDDARAQIIAKVVNNDGSTLRGVLVDLDSSALSNEFDDVTLTNRFFPVGWTGSGYPITNSISVQRGDRLILEIGARMFNSSTGNTFSLSLGYDSVQPDLAEDEVSTTAGNPWIEFSQDILFLSSTSQMTRGSQNTIVETNYEVRDGQGKNSEISGTMSDGHDGGSTLPNRYESDPSIVQAAYVETPGNTHYRSPEGIISGGHEGGLIQNINDYTSNYLPEAIGAGPVVTNYVLGAVDSGVGRRYWLSTTVDFASAPAPVGSWDVGSLTIITTYM